MASITLTLTESCSSNNHVTLAVTGDRSGTIRNLHVDDVLSQTLDNEALLDFLKTYLKIYSVGKTKVQVRNALAAGLTVTI